MCKLYGCCTLVSEHQTNQSFLKIQENQNEIHEPNSNLTTPFQIWPKADKDVRGEVAVVTGAGHGIGQ